MQRIKSFLTGINEARKRTGVIYAVEGFEEALQSCITAGYKLIEATEQHTDSIILNDEELIKKIKLRTVFNPIIYMGLESFVGPRFNDTGFVEQLVKKLIIEEPTHPVVLILYSRSLFHLFAKHYSSYFTHPVHVLDLTTEEPIEDDYA
jgi:hypothetical protein